jgi:DNA polymerase-3 subunit beta
MKLTVKRKDILGALERCAQTDVKGAVYAFGGMVQITAAKPETGGSAQLYANDLQLSIDTAIAADVESPGATGVNAKRLAAVISTFGDGKIDLRLEGTALEVRGPGQRRYSLPTIAAEEFPAAPEPADGATRFTVVGKALASLIGPVHHAVPPDDDRPPLSGVRLEGSKGVLESVATDGHRLATARVEIDPPAEFESMLPRSMVRLAERLCQAEETLTVISDERRVYVETPDTLVSSLVPGGDYPPWRELVSGANGKALGKVIRDELIAAIRGVLAASDSREASLRLCLVDPFDAIQIHLEAKSANRAVDQVSLDSDDPVAFETFYDARFLLDAAQAAPSDLRLKLIDGLVPGLIIEADGGYLAWPMPQRGP